MFSNPGILVIPKKRIMLGGESKARNRTVLNIFSFVNIGERAGSGYPLILTATKEENYPTPEVYDEFNPDVTKLTIYIKKLNLQDENLGNDIKILGNNVSIPNIIDELKSIKRNSLVAGKVDVLNVVNEEIANARLLALNRKTNIILVYDIDVNKIDILDKNIRKLEMYGFHNVFHIQSINNFEDEIVYSSSLKNINKMFNTQNKSEFKRSFLKHQNISVKLDSIDFDVGKLWSRVNLNIPFKKYSNIKDLNFIKIKN